jgi:hypothetical protein
MPTTTAPSARASDDVSSLSRAIAQTAGVPFYEASAWQSAFADPLERLSDLPRITKSQLREHSPEGFLAAGLTMESLLSRGVIEEEAPPALPAPACA